MSIQDDAGFDALLRAVLQEPVESQVPSLVQHAEIQAAIDLAIEADDLDELVIGGDPGGPVTLDDADEDHGSDLPDHLVVGRDHDELSDLAPGEDDPDVDDGQLGDDGRWDPSGGAMPPVDPEIDVLDDDGLWDGAGADAPDVGGPDDDDSGFDPDDLIPG
jgi:hypothetical protein